MINLQRLRDDRVTHPAAISLAFFLMYFHGATLAQRDEIYHSRLALLLTRSRI